MDERIRGALSRDLVGVHVLDIAADGIGGITALMDPAIAGRFAP